MEQEQQQEMTAEQLEELRGKMGSYYDTQTPLLRKQAEYESLLAQIEKARYERLEANVKYMQLQAALNANEESKQDEEPKQPESNAKPKLSRVKKDE